MNVSSDGEEWSTESGFVRYTSESDGSAVSVSALVRSVKDLLENRYRLLWVAGEISNVTLARSGHWYFVLKDEVAQVRCVMFRHRNQYLDWTPREGMQLEARATVTMYEARGEFQLNVETMREAGRGALFEAFLRLRDKLQAEGLFDADKKRALPAFPRAIGIVTSPRAAALRDILSTLKRRNPSIPVVVYPAGVQGEQAAGELIGAIERASRRAECDVIILARGGGSIEDLWCFNDEALARAIRGSRIPIVTGVGHETDFTIADFAADLRAPTPTAAAEVVAPSRHALIAKVGDLARRVIQQMERELEERMQALDYLQRRLADPRRLLGVRRSTLYSLTKRLRRLTSATVFQEQQALGYAVHRLVATLPEVLELRALVHYRIAGITNTTNRLLERRSGALKNLSDALRLLDPSGVLQRGYSIARDKSGNIVTNVASVEVGEPLTVTLAHGALRTRIDGKS